MNEVLKGGETTMDVAVIQMLVFMAVLFLVIGVNAVIRKESQTLSGAKPLVFRVFYAEIGLLGKMAGPWMDHVFPTQARAIRNDLIAAALPHAVAMLRGEGADDVLAHGIDATLSICDRPMTLDECMRAGGALIESEVARLCRVIQAVRGGR